jgi:nucleoid DNA-binding protein
VQFVVRPNDLVEGLAMADNKVGRPVSKSAMYQTLAEATGLTRKQIASVFDELTNLIKRDVGKKGPGVFALPGLLKIKRVSKPATKARQGRNPATGEPMMIKAKPARTVVRAQPLKSLKEMVK